MKTVVRTTVIAALAVWVCGARDARAQGVSVDLSAGRTVYDPLAVDVGANNVTGTVRYDTQALWIYGAAAAPLGSQDPFWTSIGTGGRLALFDSRARHTMIGIDTAAQGHLFHDRLAGQTGSGGHFDAIPFVRVSSGRAYVELRGGPRGQLLSYLNDLQRRAVVETGARVGYGTTLRVEAENRWVRASEGTYPQVGASLQYSGSSLSVWARAGKWAGGGLDEVNWGVGAAYPVGVGTSVWTSVRQEAPDPLFWNALRRSWSVGLTHQFGPGPARIFPTHAKAGNVEIRLTARDADTPQLAIGGTFNEWRAVPMRREGNYWTIELALPPGVYRYAFRAADGRWFVPPSVPNRRVDGMGGFVAVLLVT
jgi:hypothetical protein